MLTNWTINETSLLHVASVFSVVYAILGTLSTVLNGTLVIITIRCRDLHTVSNILIAIQAASDTIVTWNVPLFLYNTYTRTFIPVSTCFLYQLVPFIAMNFSALTILLIGIDRFLCFKYTIWYKRVNTALYLAALISCNVLFASSFAAAFYLTASDTPVLCFITDSMSGVVKDAWAGCQSIVNLATVLVYTNVKNALKSQINPDDKNCKKIFTSLYLIMVFYICGWFTTIMFFTANRFLTYDQRLTETVEMCLSIFAAAYLCYPFGVYYSRSEVYNREIRRLFGLIAKTAPRPATQFTTE